MFPPKYSNVLSAAEDGIRSLVPRRRSGSVKYQESLVVLTSQDVHFVSAIVMPRASRYFSVCSSSF